MSIDLKRLENCEDWIDEVGEFSNVQSVSKILDVMDKDKSYSQREIKHKVRSEAFVTREVLDGLLDLGIVGEKAGMYYISNPEKAKKIEKLAE
jgi:hypothetical protein